MTAGLALIDVNSTQTKVCRSCHIEKPGLEFKFTTYRGKKFQRNQCQSCITKRQTAWQRKNSHRVRDSYLRKTYGVTAEQYNQMFVRQGGCCALCGRHQSEFKNRLAVDHDHKTGRVRKLLCAPHNAMLGQAQDDTEILQRAIAYLIEERG